MRGTKHRSCLGLQKNTELAERVEGERRKERNREGGMEDSDLVYTLLDIKPGTREAPKWKEGGERGSERGFWLRVIGKITLEVANLGTSYHEFVKGVLATRGK